MFLYVLVVRVTITIILQCKRNSNIVTIAIQIHVVESTSTYVFVENILCFLSRFNRYTCEIRQLCTSPVKCARKSQVGGHDVVIFMSVWSLVVDDVKCMNYVYRDV